MGTHLNAAMIFVVYVEIELRYVNEASRTKDVGNLVDKTVVILDLKVKNCSMAEAQVSSATYT